jgi:beta-glucosidase
MFLDPAAGKRPLTRSGKEQPALSMRFPPGFLFGAATSAYQIEGAADEDGRGPSIWDTFCQVPGAVTHGDTAAIACDHYHRLDADLDLIAELGLTGYRFSIAWPRIVPDGTGTVNQKGLDFYRRLVDGLHARGVEPMATLYHWDLPQPLQDAGGWVSRDTVGYFCDYVQAVLDCLGDGVPLWVTVNEPFCSGMVGHLQGRHAPGIADLTSALTSTHHLLLAHGQAAGIVRRAAPGARVGLAHIVSDLTPASDCDADRAAARRLDGHENRWFLDPVLRGSYPADMVAWYERQVPIDFIRDGDMQVMAAPVDFLGINYYETKTVADDPAEPYHQARVLPLAGALPPGQLTAGGLDVRPAGLRRILRRVHGLTTLPLYITENGAAFHDYVDPEGEVDDPERISYLNDHFSEALAAIGAGVDVRGYFVWSLLDNFEWADGYGRRFGLVYVDFGTQARIPKASARWYQRLIAASAARG